MQFFKGLSANRLKTIALLKQKKYREETRQYFVEGEHLLLELAGSRCETESVIITEDWAEKFASVTAFQSLDAPVFVISRKDFDKISDTETPQGIGAVVQFTEPKASPGDGDELIIYLDKLQDPGNAGTVIRTAQWFGIQTVVFSDGSVEIYNSKTVRSSMGAIFHMSCIKDDVDFSMLRQFKKDGYTVSAASMEGKTLERAAENKNKRVLILGSESRGISDELYRLCDEHISVPRIGRGESLNAAIAGGILMYCLTRRP